ncbi:MAG: hypothetical protein AAF610_00690 [Pseudomonadota bacterium]
MPNYRLPNESSLNAMVAMIIDEDAESEQHEAPEDIKASHVGVFQDAAGAVVAQCACDFELAASVGCALSMIPPNTASDMAKSGDLTDMARQNLYEVMNMFSSLFMDDNSDHLKLVEVVEAASAEEMGGDTKTVTFTLNGGKYAGGKLSFTVQ